MKTKRIFSAIAIIAMMLMILTSAAKADSSTVDGKTRIATGNGKTLSFVKGDAVLGAYILLEDNRYCDQVPCYTQSAPSGGIVTSGVVHPWKVEANSLSQSVWQTSSPPNPPSAPSGGPSSTFIVAGTNCKNTDTECTFNGHLVKGKFWQYWMNNGGLTQQGYPISDEFVDKSTDGKPYTMQAFERAIFELHPENQPPYDVELMQLGTWWMLHHNDQASCNSCKTGPRTESGVGKKIRFEIGYTVVGYTLEFDNGKSCTNDCYVECTMVGGWVTSGVISPSQEEFDKDKEPNGPGHAFDPTK